MLVALVALTAIDLGTKEWALDSLSTPRLPGQAAPVCEPDDEGRIAYQRQPTPSRPLIDGVLDLTYAENCGAAFSLLRTAPGWLRLVVFGTTTIGAAFVLISMFLRAVGGPLFAAAVPLIVSGAIGNNLSDRPRHGFVVDFLQVSPELFDYPIFNVADIWITIGVVFLLIDGMRRPREVTVEPPAALPVAPDAKPQ